jgi:hypothetical protein
MTTKDDGVLRGFDTGATRDTGEGKLDYFGFLSPVVLKQFAKFMNMNRLQSDGQLRDSDNWQKGIPIPVYFSSENRHHMEFFEMARAYADLDRNDKIEFVGSACGLMFNVMGFLHEFLKTNSMIDFDGDEPTAEMQARQDKIKEAEEDKAKAEGMSAFHKILKEHGLLEDCQCEECTCSGKIYGFTGMESEGVKEDVLNLEEEEFTDRLYPFTFTDNEPVEKGFWHCGDCGHSSRCLDEHPCDCCDEDRSNFSPK